MTTVSSTPAPAEAPSGLVLYDLAGADAAVRFGPHCWKTRLALAHKGLDVTTVPWRFHEKEAIAFSGQGLVPALRDGAHVVSDSWRIAEYLEASYPDRPSLFAGQAGLNLTRFVNSFSDTVLAPLLARVLIMDIHRCLAPADQPYFRESREARFGMTLEQMVAAPEQALAAFRAALLPLRRTLQQHPFLTGSAPAYADYCVFGMFMWGRCVSPVELLATDDPLVVWHEALLDAFGGLGRAASRAVHASA